MSEKKTIQILNDKELIIESIDITNKKLDNFESLKRLISTLFNLKNKKLEYFIINDLGNKIIINSENEYNNYKNNHLYKIKIVDSNDKKNEDLKLEVFSLDSVDENEIPNNINESLKCWFCLKDSPIEKPFFCPNRNCLKGVHKECLKKMNEKVRCICGNIFDVSEYKSNKLINELTEFVLKSNKEKNNIINNLKNKLKKFESAPKTCEKHPKDNLIHYCYDCNKELCGTCYITELNQHKNHRLIDLESYNEIKQIMSQNEDQLKDLKNIVNEYKLIIDSLIKNKNEFLKILDNIAYNIKNEYDKYINELNKKNDYIMIKYQSALNYKIKGDVFFDSLNRNYYNEIKNIEEITNNLKLIINQNVLKNDLNNLKDFFNNIKEMDKNNYENFQKIIDNKDIFRTKIIKYTDGLKYVGEIKNNKREGKGILYMISGSKYEGDFKDNKFNGKGVYYWPDGSKYEGEFKDNQRDGQGIFYWSDGSKYEGEFKNKIMDGKGVYYWSDGSKYEGEFKDNQRDGIGVYYSNDSKITIGIYKNGLKIGKHISLSIDGNYEIKQY